MHFSHLTGQDKDKTDKSPYFIIPELQIGKTIPANTDFPDTDFQKSAFLSVGTYNFSEDKEWAARLNYPRTGLTIGYTDFGNSDKVGHALTLLPFIEFDILKKHIPKLNLQVGVGTAYVNKQFDSITNPLNRAITTKFSWAFRSFLYYDVLNTENVTWRFGLGYLHQSNGHTRLPNQGLNSLAASISARFDRRKEQIETPTFHNFKSKSQSYFSARFGIGQNVLSEVFNDKKEVYSFAADYGKIINNTFKFGVGFYYRFYEHYYDYIKNNEALVEEQYPVFRDNPFGYATNFGLFVTSELLLSHFGFEFDLGVNIYKPFYKIDWQLNEGYSYVNPDNNTITVLGELDWYYEIKRTISTRMGLKYYLWNTKNSPKHNIFIGAHINANLGQADFTDLSLGYVYRFNYRTK
ncbi:acyloxyacyl hydrolase [Winogradskyella tangerina]|uniref:acyloxyacyl hydrolase n=1 Tax=Winogradskyella tangerina TaxID=2023240 RepID=UPI000DBE56EE|nr:acyloxyacyl hydrolase [Winogradskyella tangerina]